MALWPRLKGDTLTDWPQAALVIMHISCENIRVGTQRMWMEEPTCSEEDDGIHLNSDTLGLNLVHSIVGKTQMPCAFAAREECWGWSVWEDLLWFQTPMGKHKHWGASFLSWLSRKKRWNLGMLQKYTATETFSISLILLYSERWQSFPTLVNHQGRESPDTLDSKEILAQLSTSIMYLQWERKPFFLALLIVSWILHYTIKSFS